MISQGFWQDRKVFILGHTGFRGAHLAQTLQGLGAQVSGLGLLPKTNPSFFEIENVGAKMASTFGDARDFELLKSQIAFHQPEVVFSLLGGDGLKASKDNPRETFDVQMSGSVNLLEAVREVSSVKALAFLTSDKVYRRTEHDALESDALAGSSPAATAKACVELIVESYLQSFFQPEKYNKHHVALATARMGAVVGGGDFESDSLVWQAVQSLRADQNFQLRNPSALRSWMSVDDAVKGLLKLGQALVENGPKASGAWNFPPAAENRATVRDFLDHLGLASPAPVETQTVSVHGEMSGAKTLAGLGWQTQDKLPVICSKILEWYRTKGFLS